MALFIPYVDMSQSQVLGNPRQRSTPETKNRHPRFQGGDSLSALHGVHFCAVLSVDTETHGASDLEVVTVFIDRSLVDHGELESGCAICRGWMSEGESRRGVGVKEGFERIGTDRTRRKASVRVEVGGRSGA